MMYKKNYLLFYLFLLLSFNLMGQGSSSELDRPAGVEFLCTSNPQAAESPIPGREGILINAKIELLVPVTNMDPSDLIDFKEDMFDLLDAQKDNGSWERVPSDPANYDDVDYSDAYPGEHLERLADLAMAYGKGYTLTGTGSPSEYAPAAIRTHIIAGLNFWFCNIGLSGTWFDDEIARQRELQRIAILLTDNNNALLTELNCSSGSPSGTILENILSDFPFNNFEPYDDLETEAYTGANKADIASSIIANGLIANDLAIFNEGRCVMQCAMNYVPEQEGAQQSESGADQYEGIQRDNSFHQHKRLLYTGGYGHSLITRVSFWGAVLESTNYEFEYKDDFFNYILEGCRWMIRGNTTDYSASGRYITRSHPRYNNAIDDEDMVRVLTMATGNDNHSKLEEMKTNSMDGLKQEISGNKFFRKSDYFSYHHPDYFSSVKMCSDRTVGTENVGSSNEFGFWLPYGCTFIYRNGDEYRDIFRDSNFDWEKIPGVTCPEDLPEDFEDGSPTKRSTLEGVYFVGATTNNKSYDSSEPEEGSYGVSAMNFNKTFDGKELSAKKAWFHFGDEIIALGTGIKSEHSKNICTTINQSLLGGELVTHNVEGVVDEDEIAADTRWIHHNGIGYIFPENPEVNLKTEDDVFLAWIDHGDDDELEDSYASYYYMIIPGMTVGEATSYDPASQVTVIHNGFVDQDEEQLVQAVRKGDLVGIVFYPTTPATFIYNECDVAPLSAVYNPSSFSTSMSHQVAINNETSLATDKPCILLYENGEVCISSPDRSHATINLFVITNGVEVTIPFECGLAGESTCLNINDPANWGEEETTETCSNIIYDEFDDVDSGDDVQFGNWNDGDGGGSDCKVDEDEDRAFSGEGVIRIQKDNGESSSTHSDALDLSNEDAVKVEFTFITKEFKATDQVVLEVSVNGNGGNFQTAGFWVVDQDFCDRERVFASVCISDIDFSENTVFRIRNAAPSTDDTPKAYLDNIAILRNCPDCGDEEPQGNILSGRIYTTCNGEEDQPVPCVEVRLSGFGDPAFTYTDENGYYEFDGIIMNYNYSVEVGKEIANKCGLNQVDVNIINDHVLGVGASGLDSPYKIIAADIDLNNAIEMTDRNYLSDYLADDPAVPDFFSIGSDHWFFVEHDFIFPPNLPDVLLINYIPSRHYNGITSQQLNNQDFIAMKVGDVDCSYDPVCENFDDRCNVITGGEGGDDCFDIIAENDDAEEFGDGDMDLGSSDLDLGDFLSGLRFETEVPANAIITNAFIRFTASGDDSSKGVLLNITGADPDGLSASSNQAPFEDIAYNISSRSVVANLNGDIEVSWETGEWTDGQPYETPDLSSIVQAIVNASNYSSGPFSKSMVFKISTSKNGRAVKAQTFGTERIPAELCIEYTQGPGFGKSEEVKIEIPVIKDDELALSVTPNPSHDLFNVHFDRELTSISQATVFSTDGQIKYTTTVAAGNKDMMIDAQNWPAGIYLLKVSSGDKQSVIRLVKF